MFDPRWEVMVDIRLSIVKRTKSIPDRRMMTAGQSAHRAIYVRLERSQAELLRPQQLRWRRRHCSIQTRRAAAPPGTDSFQAVPQADTEDISRGFGSCGFAGKRTRIEQYQERIIDSQDKQERSRLVQGVKKECGQCEIEPNWREWASSHRAGS